MGRTWKTNQSAIAAMDLSASQIFLIFRFYQKRKAQQIRQEIVNLQSQILRGPVWPGYSTRWRKGNGPSGSTASGPWNSRKKVGEVVRVLRSLPLDDQGRIMRFDWDVPWSWRGFELDSFWKRDFPSVACDVSVPIEAVFPPGRDFLSSSCMVWSTLLA